MANQGNQLGPAQLARLLEEGTQRVLSMAAQPARTPHTMAAQMGRLLEGAASKVPVDLDQLIQYMPLIVREKSYADLVAAKIEEKTTLPRLVAHRNTCRWGAVTRELKTVFKRRLEALEAAWEAAFERGFDLWMEEEGEEARPLKGHPFIDPEDDQEELARIQNYAP